MKTTIAIIMGLFLGFNSFSQTSSNKKLEESINEVFESYAHYNRFIGSVLISQNEDIIYNKSFGYADMENHKKNTEKSIFSIASVTKSLTAVGIMKLVEDGKLTLETSISTYFPSFIPDFSKNITIQASNNKNIFVLFLYHLHHQILNHNFYLLPFSYPL